MKNSTTPSFFSLFLENIDNLNDHQAFRQLLLKHGANIIFKDVLSSEMSLKLQNLTICFIVFAFSNDSTWVKFTHPYHVIKKNIKENLLLLLYPSMKFDEFDLIECTSESNQIFLSARDAYLTYQHDSDFYDLMANKVHVENIKKRALNARTANARDFNLETKSMLDGYKLSERINELIGIISTRYMTINEIAKQDNIAKMDVNSAESLLAEYMKDI